jgi:drug/metabolite transporter (DMT)-like permease
MAPARPAETSSALEGAAAVRAEEVANARLVVIASAAFASTGGAAIKLCGLSALGIASLRAGIAAAFLLALLRPGPRSWGWPTFLVGALQAAMMVAFVTSNKLTTAASAIYLQATAPLYVLLLSPVLLAERAHARDLGYLALFAAGLAMFFVGTDDVQATAPHPFLGNLVAAASGVGWGGTILGLRWLASRAARSEAEVARVTPLPARGRPADPAGAAAVVANALVLTLGLPVALPLESAAPMRDAMAVAWLGIVQVGLSYACLTRGLRGVPAFEASLLLLIEPVLSPLWAFLLHAERPGPWSMAGGATILAATIARTWHDRRASTTAPPAIRPRP